MRLRPTTLSVAGLRSVGECNFWKNPSADSSEEGVFTNNTSIVFSPLSHGLGFTESGYVFTSSSIAGLCNAIYKVAIAWAVAFAVFFSIQGKATFVSMLNGPRTEILKGLHPIFTYCYSTASVPRIHCIRLAVAACFHAPPEVINRIVSECHKTQVYRSLVDESRGLVPVLSGISS